MIWIRVKVWFPLSWTGGGDSGTSQFLWYSYPTDLVLSKQWHGGRTGTMTETLRPQRWGKCNKTTVMRQQQQDKSVEDKNNEATAMRTTVVRQQQGGNQRWGQQREVNSDDERGSAWNDIWANADISDSSTSCSRRTIQHHPFQLLIKEGMSVRDVNYWEPQGHWLIIMFTCLHEILVFKGTSKEIITFRVH